MTRDERDEQRGMILDWLTAGNNQPLPAEPPEELARQIAADTEESDLDWPCGLPDADQIADAIEWLRKTPDRPSDQ